MNGHRAATLWFTGLPGSGKSTIAQALEAELHRCARSALVVDGDKIRLGLCRDLGFSAADREENNRRVGELARLLVDAGVIPLIAVIAPFRQARARARAVFNPGEFLEIYCRCPLEVCEARDPKGLYKQARSGRIENFTGISSPYEEPENPELVLDTDKQSVEECVRSVRALLCERNVVSPPRYQLRSRSA